MADLLYFKYYFLDGLRKPYDKQKLIDDFEALSNYLTITSINILCSAIFKAGTL